MEIATLSVDQIKAGLQTRMMGREIVFYPSIGSTNDEAKRLAQMGSPHGTLVIADEQTTGRGRLGRKWVAPPGTCLLMSLIFRTELLLDQVSRFTMLCSLGAAEAIETFARIPVGIKWPNDLVLPNSDHRKLAGLLTENAFMGNRLEFVIVGLGINVNVDPFALGNLMTPAISLMEVLGRPVDRIALLCAILERIEILYPRVVEGSIHRLWSNRLSTLGKTVTVTTQNRHLEGVAEKVDPNGALCLRDATGQYHRILVGDVSLRPPETSID